jgi:hypothetical protein
MIAPSELSAMREYTKVAGGRYRQDVSRLLEHIVELAAEVERQDRHATKAAGAAVRHIDELVAENTRLREALRQVEPKCRQLVGTSTSNNHIAVLDECRICHARFSSREPTKKQRHRQECPFACLKK